LVRIFWQRRDSSLKLWRNQAERNCDGDPHHQGTRLLICPTYFTPGERTTVGSLLFVLASILCLYNSFQEEMKVKKEIVHSAAMVELRLPIAELDAVVFNW
jgi:hypothetical protein